MPKPDAPDPELVRSVGLCALCTHARVTETARGSRFWRCGRAADDPRFPRYPRLPVGACPGFEVEPYESP